MMKKNGLFRLGGTLLAALYLLPLAACNSPTPAPDGTGTPEEKTTWEKYWSDENTLCGLTGNSDGTMSLGGEKYNAAGINVFNWFSIYHEKKNFNDSYATLEVMAEKKVPCFRFDLMGFTYASAGDFVNRIDFYLDELDKLCTKADELHVGLIPSFFWSHYALPNYYDEPMRALFDENSNTRQAIATVTQQTVQKLQGHKSIWFWEYGNEYNLTCDLKNHLAPLTNPESSRVRTLEEDYYSASDLGDLYAAWADIVDEYDTFHRIIGSGDAIHRNNQYNLMHDSGEVDTQEQKEEAIGILHKGKMNGISEHLYHIDDNSSEYRITVNGERQTLEYSEYISRLHAYAKSKQAVFYIGEFAYDYYANLTFENKLMWNRKMGLQAVREDIPMLLYWNYAPEQDYVECSFDLTNPIAEHVFSLLQECNEEFERNNAEARSKQDKT